MTRVALRGIRAHLVRFLLSLLAVTLGVAFVAGTLSLRTMMGSTFSGIVASSMQADVYVRGSEPAASAAQAGSSAGDAREAIPADLALTLNTVDGVRHALPAVSGPIVLVGADGTAVVSTQAPTFGMALHPDDDTLDIVAGRSPVGAAEIALESATLESSGLTLGDETSVVLAGEVQTVSVVGEVSLGAPMAGATIVFLDVPTSTAAYAADGLVASIDVYGETGVDEQILVDRVDAALAAADAIGVETVGGTAMRTEATADINAMLGFVQTFMLVFAGISLFVGAFIISNTFAMSVQQRMREFALLRAVGASPGQVFASILIQAAVVGLVGSALGIAAGLGLVSLVRMAVAQIGMNLSGSIPLDPATVVISLLVGTLVSVAAAALPARRAALTPPVEAMREAGGARSRSLRLRAIVGSALTVAGLAGLVAAWSRPDPDGPALLGLGAAGVVLGVLVLAPVIARYSLSALAAVFVVAVKPLGRLARGNVIRNPRRTANTAGALMIGMALVGAASVLAASATVSTRAIVDDGWIADFSVQSAAGVVPAGVVTDLRALDTVASVDELRYGPAMLAEAAGDTVAERSLIVVALPPAALGNTIDFDAVEGTLAGFAAGQLAVQRSAAEDHGWVVGDDVTFTTAAGEASASIGAIVDTAVIGAPIIMPDDAFERIVPASQIAIDSLLITSAAAATPAEVRDDLTGAAAPYVVLSVLDKEEFAGQLAGQVDQILGILYAMLALSVIIAILGIVNTLALSVIERTREIGLMRAVGLGRMQLAGIITIESILTALFGTVLGMAVGVGIASLMPTIFTEIGLTELAIPWGQLASMLGVAALVGVLAALWPAIHAARLPVLQAVSAD
ncbi:lysophospholipase [Cryobacterium zongtaii]|uniref:Lysophospholipase n=1 Tax=Cryobacterium zongtaii TaxID=1259217 RepID=A0A2S3ZP75_9MICO|nr:FtsX-like permease family protein [Cryobacterium zongtaii]POH70476.1 lysophospholipase [Cryobacterium zongtaii]